MLSKIKTIIEMEKQIKEGDEILNGECEDRAFNKLEEKYGDLKEQQQDLIDELSDEELDLLNQNLNQKDEKKFIVKIYKKDIGIDNGIKNENGDFTKLFYAKNETEAQKIKSDGLLINKENEYKVEIMEENK